MRKLLTAAFCAFLSSFVFSYVQAADDFYSSSSTDSSYKSSDSQSDIQNVMRKISALERENNDLRDELKEVKSEVAGIKKISPEAAVPAQASTASGVPAGKVAMLANSAIEFYGFIKAEAIYSDSQAGEATYSAPIESQDRKEFMITAKGTRIGMNFTGPKVGEDGAVVGKIETDFNGNAADATTSSTLRIRQAYVDLKYPTWDVLAGQAWAFFSPLNPSAENAAALWRAGNLGVRYPQVRVTKKMNNVLGGTFTSQIGVVDPKNDDVAHTGKPVVATFNSFEKTVFGKPLFIGAGGLYGQSDTSGTNSKNVDLWAATLAFKYKLAQKVSVIAEGYTGANLSVFMGGSPTGIDHNKAVRVRGGFAQLTLDPAAKWQFNAGAGIDDVYTDSVSTGTTAVWDYNYTYFVNAKYQIAKNLVWLLEYQNFETEYSNQNSGDAQRIESSLTYNF